MIENIKRRINLMFANFIRKRGWVAFYLEEDLRECGHVCWLELYEAERERREK